MLSNLELGCVVGQSSPNIIVDVLHLVFIQIHRDVLLQSFIDVIKPNFNTIEFSFDCFDFFKCSLGIMFNFP